MESTTLGTPTPTPRGRLTFQPPTPGADRRSGAGITRRRLPWATAGLGLLLLVSLGLRLWGIGQGLPFSYNADEAQHFVPKAIAAFAGDWNPHYFLNPPAFTYLLVGVLELWFGSADAVVRAFTLHPGAVFVVARVVCAALGTVSVALLYGAGVRLFERRGVALLAAAILGLGFLPVFYSHLALNDVPTLCAVCLALHGICGIWRFGRPVDFVVAGLGTGLAAAGKYTGGWVLVLLLLAGVRSATGRSGPVAGTGRVRAAGLTLGAVGLAAVAFSAANPYWFLAPGEFFAGVSAQASAASGASEPAKLGTTPGGGILYYLWTFTWGLGVGPALAALAGIGVLVRRRRGWLLAFFVPGEVAYLIFMGLQARYFGRWLLPLFPLAALLAAWTAGELVDWAARLPRPVPRVLGGAVVSVALLAQSLGAVLHDDRVLSRPYTTNLARDWMTAHIPAGENVYVEPVIPGNWTGDIGGYNPYEPDGARWYEYPVQLSFLDPHGGLLPRGRERYVTLDQYEDTLYPGLIGQLEAHAFCWVVSGTLQSGRAFARPGEAPRAVAYYRRLARVGRLVYQISPYAPGARPVPFNFDWTIDDYPRQYRLPGPEISIYRLTGGACAG